jgi:hypothetical protein
MPTKSNPIREPSREFKDGIAVLRMCGNVSRIVYLEALAHMEEKWPDRGWILAANSLSKWYCERNLPLREKGNGIQFKEGFILV